MGKYPVTYYSASKKEHIQIEEMNPSHLLNAWKKMGLAMEVEHSEDDLSVFSALDAEVKARGLDKPKPDVAP